MAFEVQHREMPQNVHRTHPADSLLSDRCQVKKVEQVAEERDLGILITDDLKWSGATSVIFCSSKGYARHDQKNLQCSE